MGKASHQCTGSRSREEHQENLRVFLVVCLKCGTLSLTKEKRSFLAIFGRYHTLFLGFLAKKVFLFENMILGFWLITNFSFIQISVSFVDLKKKKNKESGLSVKFVRSLSPFFQFKHSHFLISPMFWVCIFVMDFGFCGF